MKDAEVILSTPTAVGRRIVITAVWLKRKADLDASFRRGNMQLAGFQAR
jgi:hypothetical protein